jgi:hypothetical protein
LNVAAWLASCSDRGFAGFESFDVDERSLGLFDTRHRAISSVREFQSDASR